MPEKHTFQAPRGTRDFYPEDMAVRRHIESVWREVSVSHGFDEIEGPNFEHLDLYTVKSGEGIVNELFSFKRTGGETMYALRPEFTPTLARMYAARAAQLPKPTKWFCIPNHFRAERPQRGRLREFIQWNADIIGEKSARADVEIIAATIGLLERFGLTHRQVTIKLNHRDIPRFYLLSKGASERQLPVLYDIADRKDKLSPDKLRLYASERGIPGALIDAIEKMIELCQTEDGTIQILDKAREAGYDPEQSGEFQSMLEELKSNGLEDWFRVEPSIVRGLAYYTGTVFEVHEATGKERAIAGGGRYDNLIELFGGPPTPAVGIAMGDVVLRLVLEDHGLLEAAQEYMPRPDVFVIAAKPEADEQMKAKVSDLRRKGYHVRHSYRSTRNVGKLLGEAGKCRAKTAIILGDELAEGQVALKNLETGTQENVGLNELEAALDDALHPDRE